MVARLRNTKCIVKTLKRKEQEETLARQEVELKSTRRKVTIRVGD